MWDVLQRCSSGTQFRGIWTGDTPRPHTNAHKHKHKHPDRQTDRHPITEWSCGYDEANYTFKLSQKWNVTQTWDLTWFRLWNVPVCLFINTLWHTHTTPTYSTHNCGRVLHTHTHTSIREVSSPQRCVCVSQFSSNTCYITSFFST